MTARDLARFGQLALDEGVWQGEGLISAEWLDASFEPRYGTGRWPAEYQDSPLADYGYGWWLTRGGARLGLGKDGQYLYIDPERRVVIVRQGESTGDFSWVELFEQVAASVG
jgi:CubicO group peptidase (beta-lactamase class C family)